MADQNPTADPRVVPVDLPLAQIEILRTELLGWLDGIELDLEHPDPLDDREVSVREADAFRRLFAALDRSQIDLPDEDAREAWARRPKATTRQAATTTSVRSMTRITRC